MIKNKNSVSDAEVINLIRECLGLDPIPKTEQQESKAPCHLRWGIDLLTSAQTAFGQEGQKPILDSETQPFSV